MKEQFIIEMNDNQVIISLIMKMGKLIQKHYVLFKTEWECYKCWTKMIGSYENKQNEEKVKENKTNKIK